MLRLSFSIIIVAIAWKSYWTAYYYCTSWGQSYLNIG